MQFTFNYDDQKFIVDRIKGLSRLNGFDLAWNQPEAGKVKMVVKSNDNRSSLLIKRVFSLFKGKLHE